MSSSLLYPITRSVTVPNGANISNHIDLEAQSIVELWTPNALTSTTLTFEIARDLGNGSYGNFVQAQNVAGIAFNVQIAPSVVVKFAPQDFFGSNRVRIKTATNETADREFFITLMRAI